MNEISAKYLYEFIASIAVKNNREASVWPPYEQLPDNWKGPWRELALALNSASAVQRSSVGRTREELALACPEAILVPCRHADSGTELLASDIRMRFRFADAMIEERRRESVSSSIEKLYPPESSP